MAEYNLLSVIVPIYNAERFLRKCLDSILAQTFKQLEIICVNDGSTDKSPEILDEYEKKDRRIRILTKPNGGLVSARKAGVKAAQGEYIGFVDADDWIEPEMYERLYGVAKQNNADFVSTDYCQEGNYTAISYDAVQAGVYNNEKMQELRNNAILHLKKRDKGVSGSLCTKLLRADILKKIMPRIPNEITVSEDKVTTVTFILECDSAVILHESYYHYVIHGNSMLNGITPNYLLNVHNVYQYFRSLYGHPNFTQTMRVQAELYVTQFLIKGINSHLGFLNPNLLWIDSYWLNEIPKGARVVLYGGGALGRKYRQQLEACHRYNFVGCVDFGYERTDCADFPVSSPNVLAQWEYDFIVITIKNRRFADEVTNKLQKLNVPKEKIRWFEQKEIFWKFAEADGLLE